MTVKEKITNTLREAGIDDNFWIEVYLGNLQFLYRTEKMKDWTRTYIYQDFINWYNWFNR